MDLEANIATLMFACMLMYKHKEQYILHLMSIQ